MNIIPQLDACCCVCSLRTGSIVAGWYGTLTGLLITISIIIGLLYFDPTTVEKRHLNVKYIVAMAIIICIISAFRTVACISLLVGVYKQKPRLFLPWIRCTIVSVVMEIIGYTGGIFFRLYVYNLISAIIFTSIFGYFILVVYSYYRQLK